MASKTHQCPQCSRNFPFLSTLQRHLETHLVTGDYMCGLCDLFFNRFTALMHHWKTACSELQEVFCKDELKAMSNDELKETAFRFTLDRFSLDQQINIVGTTTMTTGRPSVCTYCNLRVPRGCLVHHLKAHTLRESVEQEIPDSPIAYLCDLCGFGFRFEKSLFNHWRQKCPEMQAYFQKTKKILDNQELVNVVEQLMRQAELIKPTRVIGLPRELENNKKEGNFASTSNLKVFSEISSSERKLWNIDRDQPKSNCPKCPMKFVSQGRLRQHLASYHVTREKPLIICDLCQMKFKQNRTLFNHWREACKAFRVEVPDETRRKTMSKEEMAAVVDDRKSRWKEIFEKKKAENLNFITESLAEVDAKTKVERREHPVIQVPVSRPTADVDANFPRNCEFCKASFNDPRFLQRHIQTVHENDYPRQQIIIAASSLIPYFRSSEAVFYDKDGKEYNMGKYLDKDNGLAKHFKEKIVESGTKWLKNKQMEKDCFIVELHGDEMAHVVLNEKEFAKVCDVDDKLKTLYRENPKKFDDLPVLECESS